MSEHTADDDAEFRLLALRARMRSGSEIFDYDEPTIPVELPMSIVLGIGNHPFQDHLGYYTLREIWSACRSALLIDKGGA